MNRSNSISALLRKSRKEFLQLKEEYARSLHTKHIDDDMRVSIKGIFENLRSALDYIAHDIKEDVLRTRRQGREAVLSDSIHGR